MSRSEIYHTHAGNPCFLCALQDSFAVMHIASRIMPEVAFVPVPSRKLPVNFFFKDWLNSEDVPESEHSYELKQQLVAEVMKIVEELEAERNRKNEAKQEDLSEHKMVKLFVESTSFRNEITKTQHIQNF
ncbi:uncharacterized protein LOC123206995 [Mangifera indica]|uniref:uncharacterized protein LOC123197221 n=1 Tax=Mangifera indica TaxID=29780 RepID=UPI001CFA6C3C|nr:uncharacterized protein LOC123197221 [Mangifera indica]XP_044480233.1 uncharacterized protein LOC123206995 [Mangifera indica]